MRTRSLLTITIIVLVIAPLSTLRVSASGDTGQEYCYGVDGTPIPCPEPGDALFGQDANYTTQTPAFQDNGDGTVTDLNTGLMWQQTPTDKMTWEDAMARAESFEMAGYTDWRLPTIKELYSLIDFSGLTGRTPDDSIPYIDTTYFDFEYGGAGERMIDAQYWSSTEYVSTTMRGNHTVFGVNFADGRIKGYGTSHPGSNQSMTEFVRYVRGDTGYGVNNFVDNGDGTITDESTSLMWLQGDSGTMDASADGSLNWEASLSWCENLSYAGYDDWRLPDAKELQGIVDYTRSPDTTNSAAIDSLFNVSTITDEGGDIDYPFYWTSTTHLDGLRPGDRAVYIAFGEAHGFMEMPPNSGNYQLLDVHGAGAQRSDLKAGDPSQFPQGMGPQGDVQRIYNFARCVRGGSYEIFTGGDVDQVAASAQQQGDGQLPPGGPGPDGSHQPPQEAINACTGLSDGAGCTMNTPQGTLNGTCVTLQAQPACVPNR